MKVGETLVGVLIALLTLPLYLLGLLVGIGSVGRYAKIKKM